jgi:hypothetical protein
VAGQNTRILDSLPEFAKTCQGPQNVKFIFSFETSFGNSRKHPMIFINNNAFKQRLWPLTIF